MGLIETLTAYAPMRLIHYSIAPFAGPVFSREQNPAEEGFAMTRPKGFWFSVEGEDDWAAWCREQDYRLETLAFQREIVLSSDARILKLSSAMDIDVFTERYGRATKAPWPSPAIAWSQVAREHQGIIIAPYIRSRRQNAGADWYCGWDCASGCIWDAGAITEVRLLETA